MTFKLDGSIPFLSICRVSNSLAFACYNFKHCTSDASVWRRTCCTCSRDSWREPTSRSRPTPHMRLIQFPPDDDRDPSDLKMSHCMGSRPSASCGSLWSLGRSWAPWMLGPHKHYIGVATSFKNAFSNIFSKTANYTKIYFIKSYEYWYHCIHFCTLLYSNFIHSYSWSEKIWKHFMILAKNSSYLYESVTIYFCLYNMVCGLKTMYWLIIGHLSNEPDRVSGQNQTEWGDCCDQETVHSLPFNQTEYHLFYVFLFFLNRRQLSCSCIE